MKTKGGECDCHQAWGHFSMHQAGSHCCVVVPWHVFLFNLPGDQCQWDIRAGLARLFTNHAQLVQRNVQCNILHGLVLLLTAWSPCCRTCHLQWLPPVWGHMKVTGWGIWWGGGWPGSPKQPYWGRSTLNYFLSGGAGIYFFRSVLGGQKEEINLKGHADEAHTTRKIFSYW